MIWRVDCSIEGGPGPGFLTRRGKGSLWERLRKPSARSAVGRFSAWQEQQAWAWR